MKHSGVVLGQSLEADAKGLIRVGSLKKGELGARGVLHLYQSCVDFAKLSYALHGEAVKRLSNVKHKFLLPVARLFCRDRYLHYILQQLDVFFK